MLQGQHIKSICIGIIEACIYWGKTQKTIHILMFITMSLELSIKIRREGENY